VAFNPFIGRDQAWLEERLRDTQDEIAGGMSTISGGLGEAQFGRIMTIGPTQRLTLLLQALNSLDPTTYPIDDITVPTRTVMTYQGPR
jgi:hypothetical protein